MSAPEWIHSLQYATRLSRLADTRARLHWARAYMSSHLDATVRGDDVARLAGVSRYHFLREFRREFDQTPHQFLLERRIARARELLESTDRSVTDICLDVGFTSLGSFSTQFSRRVGHSPNRYRAAMVQSLGIPQPRIPGCFVSFFAAAG